MGTTLDDFNDCIRRLADVRAKMGTRQRSLAAWNERLVALDPSSPETLKLRKQIARAERDVARLKDRLVTLHARYRELRSIDLSLPDPSDREPAEVRILREQLSGYLRELGRVTWAIRQARAAEERASLERVVRHLEAKVAIVVEAIQSLELERSLHVRGTVAGALKEGGA